MFFILRYLFCLFISPFLGLVTYRCSFCALFSFALVLVMLPDYIPPGRHFFRFQVLDIYLSNLVVFLRSIPLVSGKYIYPPGRGYSLVEYISLDILFFRSSGLS